MKSVVLRISLTMICGLILVAGSHHAEARGAGSPPDEGRESVSAGMIFDLQKYYIGDYQQFGSGLSAPDDPCHDFNGDGICDLFFLRILDVSGNRAAYAIILEGNGDGSFQEAREVLLGSLMPLGEYYDPRALVLDLNGDSLDDLVLVFYHSAHWQYCINNMTDSWGSLLQYNYYMDMILGLHVNIPLVALDCEDDGIEEFAAGSDTYTGGFTQPTMILKNVPDYGGYYPVYERPTGGFVVWTHAGVGDFNGDGNADLFERSYYSGVRVHAGDGVGGFGYFDGVGSVLSGYAYRGNFNGDQYDDFIHSHEMMLTQTTWLASVWFGDAEGLREGPIVRLEPADHSPPEVVVFDFDGDGRDDVGIIGEPDEQAHIRLSTMLSLGESFSPVIDTTYFPLLVPKEPYKRDRMYRADFDEDGFDDLCYMFSSDTLVVAINLYEPVATTLQDFIARIERPGEVALEWNISESVEGQSLTLKRAISNSGTDREDNVSTQGGLSRKEPGIAGEPECEYLEICCLEVIDGKTCYSFVDEYPAGNSGQVLMYLLELSRVDGTIQSLGEYELSIPESKIRLFQNYPNPFNPSTTISFELPEKAQVRLAIYDISGRIVRDLLGDSSMGPGSLNVIWDGRSNSGTPVASGIYYYRLVSEKISISRKLVLLR